MSLINENACTSDNAFIQENYKYDIFLQVMLTAVNGVTLIQPKDDPSIGAIIDESADNSIIRRNNTPIANLYMKFEHVDEPCSMNGFQATKITNPFQKRVVEEFQ
jgi:hypothetical protein